MKPYCAGIHASTTIQLSAGLSNTIARTNFKRCENNEKCQRSHSSNGLFNMCIVLSLPLLFWFQTHIHTQKTTTLVWVSFSLSFFLWSMYMLLPHFGLMIFLENSFDVTENLCFDYSTEKRSISK